MSSRSPNQLDLWQISKIRPSVFWSKPTWYTAVSVVGCLTWKLSAVVFPTNMMLGALVVVITIALLVRAGTAACAEAVVRAGSYSTGCKETLLNLILKTCNILQWILYHREGIDLWWDKPIFLHPTPHSQSEKNSPWNFNADPRSHLHTLLCCKLSPPEGTDKTSLRTSAPESLSWLSTWFPLRKSWSRNPRLSKW